MNDEAMPKEATMAIEFKIGRYEGIAFLTMPIPDVGVLREEIGKGCSHTFLNAYEGAQRLAKLAETWPPNGCAADLIRANRS